MQAKSSLLLLFMVIIKDLTCNLARILIRHGEHRQARTQTNATIVPRMLLSATNYTNGANNLKGYFCLQALTRFSSIRKQL